MMGREPTHLDANDNITTRQKASNQYASHLVSLRDNPRAVPCDPSGGIVVLRPVASLFFGNAEFLVERMEALLQEVEAELENGLKGRGANAVDNPAAVAVVVASKDDGSEAANNSDSQPGSPSGTTRFVLLDVSGIRLLDLPALAALGEIVDFAAAKGTQVILSNGTRKIKASLQACGLWRRVGGPLVMHSTEEVFALLNHAPSLLPTLSAKASSFRLPREVGNGMVGKEESEDEE
jgi:MFS superfamily sulfate permease-like transporter